MAQSIPRTTKQWTVSGEDGFDSLRYSEQPVPELGDNQVLYRDFLIPMGKYPFALKPGVALGSDGAGTVLAVGKHVARFQPGDTVVTVISPQYISPYNPKTMSAGLGGTVDGTLRFIGAFDEQGLVTMPKGLSFTEAATLSCSGLTAWNALFGLVGKQVTVGQWVLTQGTGGVSISALQFAKAVGARVIATTSSKEKAKLLEKLGADHIINYRETPDWGSVAKELTGGVGVDVVVEVAGQTTLKQSAASLRLAGAISVVGFIGGEGKDAPNLLDCWINFFTARGVWVGNRIQMEDMCRAIEANLDKLRPVLDPKVFTLDQVKEAFEYQWAGKHQGKVGIEIAWSADGRILCQIIA
ncbi:hypothetical protein AJ80_02635 [Polytolypa hystricis UAMH7299]|uniref:Enoyl reductase (ER) domain-containing protein n=1 Tax=Polytolypa hystricis (strain UAMH7299) TaxID=1447883 RepID=A0A2B7YQA8_POLH7|nr:hypothetical protein AJ80_02635 [Polytolypa hystricis UAMH7299]